MLFSDTLRANVDPFNEHTDEEVWRSLETAHLKQFVQDKADGLGFTVAESGENLRLEMDDH